MRKHPLIALIAFAVLATSTFVGAAGAKGFNPIPTRATSSVRLGAVAGEARWLTISSRRQAAVRHLLVVLLRKRSDTFWQLNASDLVAIHDDLRPAGSPLPSKFLALLKLAEQKRAAQQAAAAHAAALAQQEAQAAEAQAEAEAAAAAAAAEAAEAAQSSEGGLGGVWLQLRLCESGDDYAANTGNGYYGAYQFLLSTWWALGYSGLPSDAPPAVQDQAAERLQEIAGWGQWPTCSEELGL
jgi:pyruvate/2-oxoglutarate dehydrogenase complex dihydrolipoamide acyltransferase (E2) component